MLLFHIVQQKSNGPTSIDIIPNIAGLYAFLHYMQKFTRSAHLNSHTAVVAVVVSYCLIDRTSSSCPCIWYYLLLSCHADSSEQKTQHYIIMYQYSTRSGSTILVQVLYINIVVPHLHAIVYKKVSSKFPHITSSALVVVVVVSLQ